MSEEGEEIGDDEYDDDDDNGGGGGDDDDDDDINCFVAPRICYPPLITTKHWFVFSLYGCDDDR